MSHDFVTLTDNYQLYNNLCFLLSFFKFNQICWIKEVAVVVGQAINNDKFNLPVSSSWSSDTGNIFWSIELENGEVEILCTSLLDEQKYEYS